MNDMDKPHFDVFEISISVPDRDKAVQEFRDRLGIEPYQLLDYDEFTGAVVDGKEKAPFKVKGAFYHAGPVRLEVLEANGGLYGEFIRKHGPGASHIGCRVSYRDYEVSWFGKRGLKPRMTIDAPSGKWAYMDTESLIGCFIELVQTDRRELGIPR
jgi:hypothetical protein